MFLKIIILVSCAVVVLSDGENRVKRSRYYSYPSRFYRRPPPPHVVKGAFSYTPPPFMAHDDSSHRAKVSKQITDGLGDDDINNLVKYLSKKDLDKIIEFAGEKERYIDKYADSNDKFGFERTYKRPERTSAYKIEDSDQRFSLNGPYVKDQEERYKVVYSDTNYAPSKPKVVYATPPTYPDEYLDKNPNENFINEETQPRIIYRKPPQNSGNNIVYVNPQSEFPKPIKTANVMYSNNEVPFDNNNPNIVKVQRNVVNNQIYNTPPKNPNNNIVTVETANVLYSNNEEPFENNNHNIANTPTNFVSNQIYNIPLETEESMHRQVTYVTPSSLNPDNVFTDSNTMKEEQLPKPINLREDDEYEVSHTNNVPRVVKSESYKVESLRDVPLMNYHNSKLHTVSSYKVPHYTITSTKSQQLSQSSSSQTQADTTLPLEKAPPGYTGEDQSDAHLKAVRIWTHRSKGTAYTLHDDGTLSLERPGRSKAGFPQP